jgi:hypothetical protein
MFGTKTRWGLVAALAGFALSCGGGGGGPTTPVDTIPPAVASTLPANMATGVATDAAVSATFSEAIDAATVTASTFTLTGGSGLVTGAVTATGSTATFTPAAALAYETTYTATLTTAIKDAAGNALAGAQNWTFTTVAAPDTTAPTVIAIDPVNNATYVAPTATVTVTFSETIDPATVTTATFTLSDGSTNVAGNVGTSATTATFTPSAPLAYSTHYTVTLTTAVQDLAGNPLAATVSSFTTDDDPVAFGAQIRNVDIAGQGTAATLDAGAAFVLEFDFTLWNAASCSRCVTQLVIGIEGEAQDCVYDDIAEEYPGDGGHASLNLTAPLVAGVYNIRYTHEIQPGCTEALASYENNPPSGQVIGVLTVGTVH